MPPHHLHPRSRMTSSLFATTVVASFFVVALPHILPCPAPRVAYADSEVVTDSTGRRRRRRRRPEPAEVKDGIVQFESPSEDLEKVGTVAATRPRRERERECPVPKPGGVIGELMGFNSSGAKTENQKQKGDRGPDDGT